MTKIGILNGPNLNRLGIREPEVYGYETLNDLKHILLDESQRLDVEIEFFQSNHEGAMIDKIYEWADTGFMGMVANPGAYTHTSVALRDAIASTQLKVVEVHISNVYKREVFRHTSMTAPVSQGIISGLGFYGYVAALHYLVQANHK